MLTFLKKTEFPTLRDYKKFLVDVCDIISTGRDQTPFVLKQSKEVATKLSGELPTDIEMESIPLMNFSSSDKDIHVKAREALKNTFLDIRESGK